MRVSKFLELGTVVCRLEATRTEDVLREILAGIRDRGGLLPEDRFEDALVALLKRESVGSTGLGLGVALPHAKLPYVREFAVGLGISRSGIDFQATDLAPVHVIFLVLSPVDDPYRHLRLMGLIAGLARKDGFLDAIRRCASAEAAIDLVREAETSLFPDE